MLTLIRAHEYDDGALVRAAGVEAAATLSTVSIASSNLIDNAKAKSGNTVTLTIVASKGADAEKALKPLPTCALNLVTVHRGQRRISCIRATAWFNSNACA